VIFKDATRFRASTRILAPTYMLPGSRNLGATFMKSMAGEYRARQREERLFKHGYDKAARAAREAREAELEALRAKTERLRALREGSKGFR
jgi:hypothetical protein